MSGRGSAVSTSVSTAISFLRTDVGNNGCLIFGFRNSFTAVKQRYIKKMYIFPLKAENSKLNSAAEDENT
jgi:hypothetical protein